jgi:hypothetical protein
MKLFSSLFLVVVLVAIGCQPLNSSSVKDFSDSYADPVDSGVVLSEGEYIADEYAFDQTQPISTASAGACCQSSGGEYNTIGVCGSSQVCVAVPNGGNVSCFSGAGNLGTPMPRGVCQEKTISQKFSDFFDFSNSGTYFWH